MKLVPAAEEASRDPALRGAPLAIYRHLLDSLDPRDWHEVKLLSVCAELGIGRTATREALDLLIVRGYMQRDEGTMAGPGQARRYRLNFTRQPPTDSLDSRHSEDPAA